MRVPHPKALFPQVVSAITGMPCLSARVIRLKDPFQIAVNMFGVQAWPIW